MKYSPGFRSSVVRRTLDGSGRSIAEIARETGVHYIGLAAENAIRPFVPGPKNWLFSGSPRGAEASCAVYSLIETAKRNGLDPFAYLNYVFTKAPTVDNEDGWDSLLPHQLDQATLTAALPTAIM